MKRRTWLGMGFFTCILHNIRRGIDGSRRGYDYKLSAGLT